MKLWISELVDLDDRAADPVSLGVFTTRERAMTAVERAIRELYDPDNEGSYAGGGQASSQDVLIERQNMAHELERFRAEMAEPGTNRVYFENYDMLAFVVEHELDS